MPINDVLPHHLAEHLDGGVRLVGDVVKGVLGLHQSTPNDAARRRAKFNAHHRADFRFRGINIEMAIRNYFSLQSSRIESNQIT